MTFPFFSAMIGIVFMAGMVSLVLSIAGVIPRTEMPTLIISHAVVGLLTLGIHSFVARKKVR
jgi:ABC-type multidrug transport system permease subunit